MNTVGHGQKFWVFAVNCVLATVSSARSMPGSNGDSASAPEDFASTAFLASDRSANITGSDLRIDGGFITTI